MERLEEVEHPKPGKDFIYNTYNAFRDANPWMQSEGVRPKSIAREMFEDYMDFEDYIKEYKLERSEAILLRHLSEVFKVLSQTLPPAVKDENLLEAENYLKDHVTNVDSSLIDEWELMQNPNYLVEKEEKQKQTAERPLSQQTKKLNKLIREKSLNALKHLAYDKIEAFLAEFLPEDRLGEAWNFERLDPEIDAYFDTHGTIRLDPEARNQKHTVLKKDLSTGTVEVTQILCDSSSQNDWGFSFVVDLKASDEEKKLVCQLEALASLA
jgi:hypothetical protein